MPFAMPTANTLFPWEQRIPTQQSITNKLPCRLVAPENPNEAPFPIKPAFGFPFFSYMRIRVWLTGGLGLIIRSSARGTAG